MGAIWGEVVEKMGEKFVKKVVNEDWGWVRIEM